MAGEMQGEMGDAGGGKVGGTQKLMGGGGMGVVKHLEGIVHNSDEKRGIGRANVRLFKEISEGRG